MLQPPTLYSIGVKLDPITGCIRSLFALGGMGWAWLGHRGWLSGRGQGWGGRGRSLAVSGTATQPQVTLWHICSTAFPQTILKVSYSKYDIICLNLCQKSMCSSSMYSLFKCDLQLCDKHLWEILELRHFGLCWTTTLVGLCTFLDEMRPIDEIPKNVDGHNILLQLSVNGLPTTALGI